MGSFKTFLKENEDLLQHIYDILDEMSEEELDEFGDYLYYEFFDNEETEEDDYEGFTIDDVKEMVQALGPEMFEDILDLLSVEEIELDDDEESEGSEKDEVAESLNESWVKLSTIKPDQAAKIKTKKSGDNYFYVVSTDVKAKTFDVVTPKAYNNDELDKTLTVHFADVVSVSTSEYAEKDERGSKKPTGRIVHYASGTNSKDDEVDEAVARRFSLRRANKKKRKFMKNTKAQLRRTATARKRKNRETRSARKRYYMANRQKIKSYQKSRTLAVKKGKHFAKVRRNA